MDLAFKIGDLATDFFLTTISSDDSSEDYTTCFFLDWAFCSGDFATVFDFFGGASSSELSSSLDSTFFDFLTTFLTFLTVYYSELSSSLDCWATFFLATAFWSGDLDLTTFLETLTSSSLDS